jgi:hypothetical protein
LHDLGVLLHPAPPKQGAYYAGRKNCAWSVKNSPNAFGAAVEIVLSCRPNLGIEARAGIDRCLPQSQAGFTHFSGLLKSNRPLPAAYQNLLSWCPFWCPPSGRVIPAKSALVCRMLRQSGNRSPGTFDFQGLEELVVLFRRRRTGSNGEPCMEQHLQSDGAAKTGGTQGVFPHTRCGQLAALRGAASTQRQVLYDFLIRRYWKPVYCFLLRKGLTHQKAEEFGEIVK